MRSQVEKPRQNIYETITAKIVAAVEASPGDPVMPWQRGGFNAVLPKNAVTGHDYRGINILSLWVTALERGYEAGLFATYKQWAAIGAQVRKGETAAPIVFYRQLEIAKQRGATRATPRPCALARGYWVFAAEQVDGFTARPRCRPIRSSASPLPMPTSLLPAPVSSPAAAAPAIVRPPIPSTCRTRRASSTATAARARKRSTACSATSWCTGAAPSTPAAHARQALRR